MVEEYCIVHQQWTMALPIDTTLLQNELTGRVCVCLSRYPGQMKSLCELIPGLLSHRCWIHFFFFFRSFDLLIDDYKNCWWIKLSTTLCRKYPFEWSNNENDNKDYSILFSFLSPAAAAVSCRQNYFFFYILCWKVPFARTGALSNSYSDRGKISPM